MLYMVNPSEPPKRKRGRRRNPELLIVNPYSLGDRKEKTMARTKRRRRRRRNPSVAGVISAVKSSAEGVLNVENLKQAAWIGASGAVATGVLAGRLGNLIPALPSVAGFNLTGLVVSLAVGVTTAAVGGVVGGLLPGQVGSLVNKFAVAGSQGALIFGLASFLAPLTARATALVPGAGLGAFMKMPFSEPDRVAQGYQGYEPEGRWVPNAGQEYVRMSNIVPTITPAQVAQATPSGLGGYERLGDIYGSQRLGSFEREGNLGGFVAEPSNTINQQTADEAAMDAAHEKHEGGGWDAAAQAQGYGAYESFGAPGQLTGGSDFTPLWS